MSCPRRDGAKWREIFIKLLIDAHNPKLVNYLFQEFSIYYFQTVG